MLLRLLDCGSATISRIKLSILFVEKDITDYNNRKTIIYNL